MVIVRLLRDIKSHFPARRSECALAGMLFTSGVILLHPAVTFNPAVPVYRGLISMATEETWGWGCLVVGAARLIALFINGTFSHTRYGRWSPHVRFVMAFVSCFFWAAITAGLLLVQLPLFGLAQFPFLLLLDMSNAVQAIADAGEVDRARRDVPR